MSMTTTGPSTVDQRVTGPYQHLGSKWARRDWLIQKHQEEKKRISTVTNIVNGEWYVEWPDLSNTPEAPAVANIIEMGVNHWSSVGGAILPSIRVPVNVSTDRSQAKRGARKRERRLRELWEASNTKEIASLLWGDYSGAGFAVLGAWANFEEPDPAKRNPYFIRFDPRHCYTIKDNLGTVVELLVARAVDMGELKAEYAGTEVEEIFKSSKSGEVEEWFWYTPDRFFHALVDVSKDGRKNDRTYVLVDEENELGFVPVAEAVRPTFDGQRRGVFDQTVHILRTMQRLMVMTIYSTEEHAFPAIGVYDVANPNEFGPGAIMQFRSAEAKIDRIGPQSHFDVKDLIARLGEDANRQSNYPQQLSGDPGASIVSARGIKASMGALDARLAVAHAQFEVLFSKASGFLLAMDQVYCPGDKTILGDWRDDSPAESFNPERDINGAWKAHCTYGIAAGSDPANVEVRLSMHLANGLLSKEMARQQLPFLTDPDAEPIRILRENMQEAVIMGILAKAQQGDPSVAAEVLKMLGNDEIVMDEIIEKVLEVVAPAAPEQGAQGAGGALGALQGAESLARGGVPGQASQAPPGAGLNLPPLGQMMGQDARLVS